MKGKSREIHFSTCLAVASYLCQMPQSLNLPDHLKGLRTEDVTALREKYGWNDQVVHKRGALLEILWDVLREPMLLLLIAVSVIYFILGQFNEAWFMLGAIILVSGISFYQDNRSRKALEALKALTAPMSKVVRDGEMQSILTREIVPGDLVIAAEGGTINADGQVMYSHDFSVNESALTGEAHTVFKSADPSVSQVYSGTLVASGIAVYKVENIGTTTRIGQLGASLRDIDSEPTPLQKQIVTFVRRMAIIGIVFFLLIWGYNFWESRDLLASLLKGLTLAMSILPEEIPVAFTTFMALGSRRMMRSGIIVKRTQTVETLGSATVICADKTGTITSNQMELKGVYVFEANRYYNIEVVTDAKGFDVVEAAMWASEPMPFDPMEKTIHRAFEKLAQSDRRKAYRMVHEYPLGGVPPMMTHVFEDAVGHRIIAAKGAPEAILRVSRLEDKQAEAARKMLDELSGKGYRVLGVVTSAFAGNHYPDNQEDLPFTFLGFVAFEDPPKKGIDEIFRQFYEAGIDLKIITGDNALTTKAIARAAGLRNPDSCIDGDELMQLDPGDFKEKVKSTSIFTRMFPEAKLAAIDALKAEDEVVAMVGDGVNDGPALKSAHIGIAMGQRGTEIAKAAADLILVQDDFARMVEAVATGRRIYDNLKKAVQYIISIHIPIILTVSLPLFFGWVYPDIFTPVHVIFLELVMGPTCSIVYENEPMEKNTMQRPPRALTDTFLNGRELMTSILQGLVITVGVLGMYRYAVSQGGSEEFTRTMVFTTLVLANVFLSLVNRSFYFSVLETLRYKNRLLVGILLISLMMLTLMLYVDPVTSFFHLMTPHWIDLLKCAGVAAISVLWFDVVKLINGRGSAQVSRVRTKPSA